MPPRVNTRGANIGRVSKGFNQLLRTRAVSSSGRGKAAGKKDYSAPSAAIDVDFSSIITLINGAVQAALEDTITRGYDTAIAHVPVRRVFKGGRVRRRMLSVSELRDESEMFLRLFSPAQRKRLRTSMQGADYLPSRLGVKTVIHRARGTLWHQSEIARRVNLVDEETRSVPDPTSETERRTEVVRGTGRLVPATPYLQPEHLNAEGRRALRGAQMEGPPRRLRDVGYGAVSQGTVITPMSSHRQLYIGGTLKHSIHMTEDAQGFRHIVAGGGDAYYAQYMEFGTRFVAARPFMRPALVAMERDFPRRLMRELNQLAKANPVAG